MRIYGLEDQIHIVDDTVTVKDIIKDVVRTKKVSDPFFIFDVGNLVHKIQLWREKLPRVKPYYTVTCNGHFFMLEILAAFGLSFDCSSRSEIKKILDLGVDPSRIIFANPTKMTSHIRYAMSQCVNLTTFDNEQELYKIRSYHPSCKLVIRIRCDATETQRPFGITYGCDPHIEAPTLLLLASRLGLSVVGVSFHLGSSFNEAAVLQNAISTSAAIFRIAQGFGFTNMYLLSIGGGFPGNENASFERISDVINDAINEWFPLDNGVTIIAEPGRFFATSAFTLATQILNMKKCSNDINHTIYGINDGAYGSFSAILYYKSVVVPKPLNDYPKDSLTRCSIWGPKFDTSDKVIDSVYLPPMKMGDWIIFENMGAYTLPTDGILNGTLRKIHTIATGEIWQKLKNLMPISEDHFTTVPVVAVIKMQRAAEASDDDTIDENDIDFNRQYPCIRLQNSLSSE